MPGAHAVHRQLPVLCTTRASLWKRRSARLQQHVHPEATVHPQEQNARPPAWQRIRVSTVDSWRHGGNLVSLLCHASPPVAQPHGLRSHDILPTSLVSPTFPSQPSRGSTPPTATLDSSEWCDVNGFPFGIVCTSLFGVILILSSDVQCACESSVSSQPCQLQCCEKSQT